MNISKPIEINYKWDLENFIKAFENAYNYEYKNSIRRYIGWLFIAMAQFGVVAALKGGSIGLLLLSTILIFYWYVAKKYLLKKRALKSFNNSQLKNSIIKLIASADGIEQNSNLISWDRINGIVSVNDDILLYINNKPYYIPSLAFDSLESRVEFKSLAKSKGKLYD